MTFCPREPVPDLLKRFVPTSFKLIAKGYSIDTNDVGLLDSLEQSSVQVPAGYHLRLVRDDEIFWAAPSTRTSCTRTSCLILNMGTVIMVDRERRYVFAFVSPETTAESFARDLLPSALNHGH